MKYRELRDSLKTGDVIAFSGKGRVSEVIKWATGSKYSHVGMVFLTEDGVRLAESTTLANLTCTVTHKRRRGAQMVPLSLRLSTYEGEVWVAQLNEIVPPEPLKVMRAKVFQWMREEVDYDTIQAAGAGIDFWDCLGFSNDPDFSQLFCSELVSRAHQIAGLLPETFNPSEATPADVMDFDHLCEPVRITG